MKLKALLLALLVAGVTASFAVADDGHGKKGDRGKNDDRSASTDSVKPASCRPSIELELRGTVAAAPSATALAVLVTKGGGEGASLAGKQLTLDVANARKPTAALKQGDTVRVKARACVDLTTLTVKLVAESVALRKDDDRSTSSTTTTTSTSLQTTTR
jgi:hypothetical protein